MRKYLFLSIAAVLFAGLLLSVSSYFFRVPVSFYDEGEILDSLDGVHVFYNGSTSHIKERNTSENGYNIGLKWQCVEFVKRYYLEVYDHEMPNSYGNAVDFFNSDLSDGELNADRGLIQYSNPSHMKPVKGDIIVYSGGYGHVAIASEVSEEELEVIQQNVYTITRDNYNIATTKSEFKIENPRILGFLRFP